MVSQLILLCDRCFAQEQKVEGVALKLGINAHWYEVHLCSACQKDMEAGPFIDVVEFYVENGEVLEDGRSISLDTLPCLWCEKTYTSQGGLDAHLRSIHSFRDPEEAWGNRCPLCGSSDFGKLSMHTQRRHQRHVSVAMLEALNGGDPYRVVGERKKASRNR